MVKKETKVKRRFDLIKRNAPAMKQGRQANDAIVSAAITL